MTESDLSLPQARESGTGPAEPDDAAQVLCVLVETLGTFLGATADAIDPHRPLAEYGIDSVDLLTLVLEIQERLGRKYPPGIFFDVDTLDQLADRISRQDDSDKAAARAGPSTST
ncbi:MAG: acyl carrier protein [Methylobacteriaceae bacterium]|nr:acyl carrier protein [Methylobacteriaceae bacterium]